LVNKEIILFVLGLIIGEMRSQELYWSFGQSNSKGLLLLFFREAHEPHCFGFFLIELEARDGTEDGQGFHGISERIQVSDKERGVIRELRKFSRSPSLILRQSLSCLILSAKTSQLAKTSKRGLRGQPWRTPPDTLKEFVA